MEHQALPTLQEVAATLSGDLEDDAVAKPYPTCFGGLEQPNPYHPIPNMLWSSHPNEVINLINHIIIMNFEGYTESIYE